MKTSNVIKLKKSILPFFTATCLLLSTLSYGGVPPNDSSDKDIVVQYLGTVYGQPLFHFNVKNQQAEEIIITLENLNGEILYSKKMNDKVFDKKIQVSTLETEINLILRVYSTVRKTDQVFEINKFTRLSDDLVMNKLK